MGLLRQRFYAELCGWNDGSEVPSSLFQTLTARLLALCVLALCVLALIAVVAAVAVPSALILVLLATAAALGFAVLAVLFGKGTVTIRKG